MRNEKEELKRTIQDLQDLNKICIAAAHRASAENEEFKAEIQFLKGKVAYLESQLRLARSVPIKAVKPQSTAQPNSSDLLYFLEATRDSTRTSPNLSELWSEATDVPTPKKRAKSEKSESDAKSKAIRPGH